MKPDCFTKKLRRKIAQENEKKSYPFTINLGVLFEKNIFYYVLLLRDVIFQVTISVNDAVIPNYAKIF